MKTNKYEIHFLQSTHRVTRVYNARIKRISITLTTDQTLKIQFPEMTVEEYWISVQIEN